MLGLNWPVDPVAAGEPFDVVPGIAITAKSFKFERPFLVGSIARFAMPLLTSEQRGEGHPAAVERAAIERSFPQCFLAASRSAPSTVAITP